MDNDGGSDTRERYLEAGMDMEGMEELLELYRKLNALSQEELPLEGELRVPGGEEAAMRLSEGFTLLDPSSVLPATAALVQRAGAVLDAYRQHAEEGESVDRLAALLEKEERVAEIARAYLDGGESELIRALQEEELPTEAGFLVFFNSLKPVFLGAAQAAGEPELKQWSEGSCPVCGGLPATASLEGQGGKRYLTCHRCQFRWPYRRIHCPFCGNEEHKSQGYFVLEEGGREGVRVDTCSECGSYIKSWDVRDIPSLRPEEEDLVTLQYDLAASGEGYHRGAPNIFGVVVNFSDEE